jgi:hypothetical protein
MDIEHEWTDYITAEAIETVWQQDRAAIYNELLTIYMMHSPPEWYVREYWMRTITAEWRRGGDWGWLWSRTGRPQSTNSDIHTLQECSRVHLDDCLSKSYPFCDLKSRSRHDVPGRFCINCHAPIVACDSLDYCARCYRQQLNKWRPI